MENTLLNEIRTSFYSIKNGLRPIMSDNAKGSYIYKNNDEYGVAIPIDDDIIVNEKFTNVHLRTVEGESHNKENKYLVLTTELEQHKYEFASFCSHFVSLGIENENRNNILNNPLDWWNKWSEILGNKLYNKKAYSIIAELITIKKIRQENEGIKIHWGGPTASTIDIETNNNNYEVKSSLVKFENEVTISSQFQLTENKNMYLVYYKMEKSNKGYSINDLVKLFENDDKLFKDVEKKLKSLGYDIGSSVRNEKYIVHEIRKYLVDDDFPKITLESFKDNKMPENIKKISYTISLNKIKYDKWE